MDLVIALFLIQGTLGAFDILYHHELTERLPWRREARQELFLHGFRNALYITLYLSLGWFEFRGAFAWLLVGILAIEAVITFWDFIVEDQTRALPWTERTIHGVLTMNYGIILALFIPEIIAWAERPTEMAPVDRGLWVWGVGFYLAGVIIWTFRDIAMAMRLCRPRAVPAGIGDLLPRPESILVTGGTGLIGSAFCQAMIGAGHHVTVLTRDKSRASGLSGPVTLIDSLDDLGDDTRFDAIVNLAGEPLADARWTRAKKHRIVRSRLDMTREVVRFIARAETKPRVLINGSAIGYYGDETIGSGFRSRTFSQRLCRIWEAAARGATAHGVRVCTLRIGIVLAVEGGALGKVLPLFDLGIAGRMGNGRQWMSWIHIDDVVRLIAYAIATESLHGPVNATAPVPVRNDEFTATLGRVMRRPAVLAVSAVALRLALGQMAKEILLSGPFVLPRKAQGAGFRFRHPTLEGALDALLTPPARKDRAGMRYGLIDAPSK